MVESDHTTRRNVLKRGAGAVAASVTGLGLVGSVNAASGSVIRMEADPGGSYDFFVRGSFYDWEWTNKESGDGVIQDSPGSAIEVSGSVSSGFLAPGWDELQVDEEITIYDIEPYGFHDSEDVVVKVDGQEI
ncbi:twin-arginine translocation signal domain-containing protein [Halomarina rubra]|uniref:Twin-arginine translocation signal domain-containing protein n=1 Tax=Halomarina rubra TaxID=2071873 RepID=A0ABD6AWT4_9EURY|nr:twin-arginine translocation signal domain-containing protein [Halomarina rubra]